MKRILSAFIAIASVGSAVFAEDAKPVGPAVSFEFSQKVASEFVNGAPHAANTYLLYSEDAAYSNTGVKATATYDLGDGLAIAPAFWGSFEVKGNNTATANLGKDRYRTRFAPNVTVSKKFSPDFSLGLNLEYRIQTDLNSALATALYSNQRINPTLLINGKVSVIDYSVAQSYTYYLDSSGGNGSKDAYFDLYGIYTVGYNLKLNDELTTRFQLSDTFEREDVSKAQKDADATAGIYNYLNLKVALVNGGFTPYVGGSLVNITDKSKAAATLENYKGIFVGADFAKGAYSLGVKYDVGKNTGHESSAGVSLDDTTESQVSVTLKIKG